MVAGSTDKNLKRAQAHIAFDDLVFEVPLQLSPHDLLVKVVTKIQGPEVLQCLYLENTGQTYRVVVHTTLYNLTILRKDICGSFCMCVCVLKTVHSFKHGFQLLLYFSF